MNIRIKEVKGVSIAEVISNNIIINNVQDALDVIGNCDYLGARNIILRLEHIDSAFFDLSTGMAGEILQKFSTYRVRLAIVGDFGSFTSKSLNDFMLESNKYGLINFVGSLAEAEDKLVRWRVLS